MSNFYLSPSPSRTFVNAEIPPDEYKKIEKLVSKTGTSKSVMTRAIVKLGVEHARKLSSGEGLIKLVKLGKL